MKDEYFMKDEESECAECHKKNSMRELIENGGFDEMCFDEDCDPFGFNPFDDPKRKGHGTDRIAIPFNCHCKHCDAIIVVNMAVAIFGYDVYDSESNVITTGYTERVE